MADAELLAILVQRHADVAAKHATQVEHAAIDGGSDVLQGVLAGVVRGEMCASRLGEVAMSFGARRRNTFAVDIRQDAMQKIDDAFFHHECINVEMMLFDVFEDAPLRAIHGSICRDLRRGKFRVCGIRGGRLERGENLTVQLGRHTKPIAAITISTDRPTDVGVLPVVKHGVRGVRNERSVAVLLDPHRVAWEHEKVRLRRAGLMEAGVFHGAAEAADADQR
jgi:hypothetical protein